MKHILSNGIGGKFNITYNNYIHLLDGYIFDGNGYKIEINHPIGLTMIQAYLMFK